MDQTSSPGRTCSAYLDSVRGPGHGLTFAMYCPRKRHGSSCNHPALLLIQASTDLGKSQRDNRSPRASTYPSARWRPRIRVVMVFLLHTVTLPAGRHSFAATMLGLGRFGVDLFFCLSRCLITGTLSRQRRISNILGTSIFVAP